MLTAIKINKMRRLPATFKQHLTTKQLKSNSIINLIITYQKKRIHSNSFLFSPLK
jgi:hypothetical protein